MNPKPLVVATILALTSPCWLPVVIVCLPVILLTWLFVWVCGLD